MFHGSLRSEPSTIQVFPRTLTKLPTCGMESFAAFALSFITAASQGPVGEMRADLKLDRTARS
jgi:hypothetical protein